MAYDVSALTNYTAENVTDLVHRSLFLAKTLDLVKKEGVVMTDIKSAEKIELMDTDAIFQAGGTCGFTSSGSTSFTQRTLTIGKIKINESLCAKTLETKYTQKALKTGSRYDSIPFEQQYTELKAGTISDQLETAVWQGDTTSVNANLARFDGYIKLIDAAAVAIQANSATYIAAGAPIVIATGITLANVKGVVNAMWLALPAKIQGKADIRILCGWDTFNKFISAYTDVNLFHFAPGGNEVKQENGEVVIPGTNYVLTAVHGLDGTNRLFAVRMSNMYIGTDLMNEEERWEIFFAKEADEIRFVSEFKYGVNVALPNEIVTFTLA